MTRIRWECAVSLAFFVTLSVLATPAPAPSEQATRIVRFVPDTTVRSVREGKCWTGSIAVSRPDAWRCMIGNEIVDPCFASADSKFVVCGPNPAKGDPGFGLKLTEPLPKSDVQATPSKDGGWLVELADGTLCRPRTGAGWEVQGKLVNYYCESKQKGRQIDLLEELNTSKPLWTAQKATIANDDGGPKLLKLQIMGVKTVWQ